MTALDQEYFEDIRPYGDGEVRRTLRRLFADREFLGICARYLLPVYPRFLAPLARPCMRRFLRHKTKQIRSVRDFQIMLAKYYKGMVRTTTDGFTVSGLDELERGKPYLFIGNHRDITLDPAFLNYAFYLNDLNDFRTVRIAMGDNLLRKPYATDLMRLNQGFIVRRSVTGPKAMMQACQQTSAYLQKSLRDGVSVWIAQRSGRAKDGWDRTDPAIIKMFAISMRGHGVSFAEVIRRLRIVPVAISYEFDPCDLDKAQELQGLQEQGRYEKNETEDLCSIATGIMGYKGRVHLHVGERLEGEYVDADAVAAAVDAQIARGFRLFPSHCEAWQRKYPGVALPAYLTAELQWKRAEYKKFQRRLEKFPGKLRDIIVAMYANPVENRLRVERRTRESFPPGRCASATNVRI